MFMMHMFDLFHILLGTTKIRFVLVSSPSLFKRLSNSGSATNQSTSGQNQVQDKQQPNTTTCIRTSRPNSAWLRYTSRAKRSQVTNHTNNLRHLDLPFTEDEVMANRLAGCLYNLVTISQSVFTIKRHIHNNFSHKV